jgi:hypothetical protein
MPVLIIAVVFLLIFLVMGVLTFSAMAAEHKGHLFSWRWADQPKPTKVRSKPNA